MRKLGSFPTDQAECFVDFLVAHEMPAQISPAKDGGFDLWIVEEDHLPRAREEFAAFVAAPDDPKYRQVAAKAEQIRRQQLDRVRQYRKNVQKVHALRQRRLPPVCMVLLFSCIAVFALTGFSFDPRSSVVQALSFMAAPATAELVALSDLQRASYSLQRGEIWRAVTPALMHGDFIHIIFNMIWLIFLGTRIERREGSALMVTLVLLAAVIPNLLQGLMPLNLDGSVPRPVGDMWLSRFCGFSGVAYALFGFVWMRGAWKGVPEYILPTTTVVLLMAWLMLGVMGLDYDVLRIEMANWAHGGGLFVGLWLGSLEVGRSAKRR